jgi:excisionase family DNA binding protein
MDDENARAARAAKGSPFLDAQQAAFYLGVSVRTLQVHRSSGTGPAYRRHGRRIRYHIDDLERWSKGLSE